MFSLLKKPQEVFGWGWVLCAAYNSELTVFGLLWTLTQTLFIRVSKLGTISLSLEEMREDVPGWEKLCSGGSTSASRIATPRSRECGSLGTLTLTPSVSHPRGCSWTFAECIKSKERNRPKDESNSCRLDARTLTFTIVRKMIELVNDARWIAVSYCCQNAAYFLKSVFFY